MLTVDILNKEGGIVLSLDLTVGDPYTREFVRTLDRAGKVKRGRKICVYYQAASEQLEACIKDSKISHLLPRLKAMSPTENFITCDYF